MRAGVTRALPLFGGTSCYRMAVAGKGKGGLLRAPVRSRLPAASQYLSQRSHRYQIRVDRPARGFSPPARSAGIASAWRVRKEAYKNSWLLASVSCAVKGEGHEERGAVPLQEEHGCSDTRDLPAMPFRARLPRQSSPCNKS